jgi:predicted TIM-barrel fold metal-dependent hydrolase
VTPRLPIHLGLASSDEYEPVPLSPVVREATRRALADLDANARRRGVSRRSFLRSACGAATVLLALDGCSRDSDKAAGRRTGGSFTVPTEAGVDPDAAAAAIGGAGFVMDVQNHFLEYDLSEEGFGFGSGFPQADCGEADARACFAVDRFMDLVFAQSDTTVAVLSAIPAGSSRRGPLSIDVMDRARGVAERVCGEGRLLIQGQATPSQGALDAQLADMEDLARNHRIAAWKVYTHFPGPGWRLDRGVGTSFLEQALRLDVPIVSVHKGFSGGDAFASPADIGPAARAHPDVGFVVYHSGYEPGQTEGPYDAATAGRGSNRLITSLRDAGVGPNANVYAELGSTWFNVMRDPTEAAHVLGKLLRDVGEDNVVWGTDSIWYGSPQGQIQAFRAFQISPELQERFGYPALTDAVKAKVLGLNAARVYGVDPASVTRCEVTPEELRALSG